MAGKYEVYRDKSSGFRFRLKAAHGEAIASSESYKTKAITLAATELKVPTNPVDATEVNVPWALVKVDKLTNRI